jgi:hypothetical protein
MAKFRWLYSFNLCLYVLLVIVPGAVFASVGNVLSVSGLPQLVLKADASAHGLGPGAAVDPGDAVTTDAQSTAKIHLIDETILDVHSQSHVIIPNIMDPTSARRTVLIEVQRGKIRARVNRELERTRGRFEIHTYAASLGVEGTDFFVEVAPPDRGGVTTTTITVFEGKVAVRGAKDRDNPAGAKLELTAGMRYTATAKIIGQALEQDAFRPQDIEMLDAPALQELSRQAKLENATFLQSVSVAGGFGLSTLNTIGINVAGDKLGPLHASSRTDALFKKRFRDDEFSTQSNLVNLTIGFP